MSILFGNLFENSNQTVDTLLSQVSALTTQSSSVDVGHILTQLIAGQAVSGEVTEFSDNQLQLLLSDGSTIHASVDANINVQVGQTMFFEVASSSESTIALRPMFTNLAVEENAMKALDMANLPVTEETVQLVKSMMDYQMPIDKQSVMSMYKEMATYPEANPSTLVALRYFNIPITNESIMQYEQYQQHEHQIVNQLQTFINQVPDLLQEMLGNGQSASSDELMKFLDIFVRQGENSQGSTSLNGEQGQLQSGMTTAGHEQGAPAQGMLQEAQATQTNSQGNSPIDQKLMEQFMRLNGTNQLDYEIQHGKEMGSGDQNILKQIMLQIQSMQPEDVARQVLEAKELMPFIKELLKNEWLLKPDNLDQKSVEELYKQLSEQTDKVLNHLSEFGREGSNFANATDSLRQNLDFMNQVNQFASYVQLPLKMSEQNTHAELYVYADKQKLRDKEDNFTALLHLEMDHLGMVDVYVTLQDNRVSTNFTLEEEESLLVVEEHIEVLHERLAQLGYEVNIEVSVGESTDSVPNALFKDAIVEGDSIKSHYSFDIRA
ncbi:MAG: flagellar hook-length control protein FliK [Eubacteriales bacterium]